MNLTVVLFSEVNVRSVKLCMGVVFIEFHPFVPPSVIFQFPVFELWVDWVFAFLVRWLLLFPRVNASFGKAISTASDLNNDLRCLGRLCESTASVYPCLSLTQQVVSCRCTAVSRATEVWLSSFDLQVDEDYHKWVFFPPLCVCLKGGSFMGSKRPLYEELIKYMRLA